MAIERDEIMYLWELSSRYFRRAIVPADVVWTYSGVRPLVEDEAASASAVTRDYRLEFDKRGAPLLSVFGGKITTFRKLAEEAVDMLAPSLSASGGAWTGTACLPGGDLFGARPANRSVLEFERYVQQLQQKYPWLPGALTARYARAYGTRTEMLLAGRCGLEDMGEEVLPGLYAAEVDYLMQLEWALNAQDILWRRSKLGLHMAADAEAMLDHWIQTNRTIRDKQADFERPASVAIH